jgi:phage recombination protein Bet
MTNEVATTEINLPDVKWTKDLAFVKETFAKNCSEQEFKLLVHLAREYNLNPLKKEIWAIKYQNNPALIFVGRDGLLNIAHKSGKFGSMETTCELDTQKKLPISATCKIYRTDYDKPFVNTVYFDEYNRKMALWLEKPKAMLMKVAEVTTLRRAFNVSGCYAPEEFDGNGNAKGDDVK